MTLDLHNFFKFYDEKNSNHVAAVQWLEDNLPAQFLDDSETDWIGIFRTKPPTPEVLAVPYFNQVDNYRDAHRTCNSSSCAMCLAFLKPGSIKGDDEYVKKVFAIGDTTDHAVQTKVLAGYGVKSHFSYNLSFADVDKSLDAGKYGSLNDNYTGPVTNGKKTIYTKAVLKHRWCPGGNDGWGRIFD